MEIGDNRKEWYDDYYNNYCVSAKPGKIRDTMHNLIEKRNKNLSFSKVLEIGAHNGEHLEYVSHSWDSYVMIDLDLPDEATIASFPHGVKFLKADVEKLPFEDNSFDRVVITCVLHHLVNPEEALREVRRVLKIDGKIDILLPNDPGLTYRMIKYVTSNMSAIKFANNNDNLINIKEIRKIRYSMKLFHIREHRNHAEQLRVLIEYTFRTDDLSKRFWPPCFKSWNLGIFTLYGIKKVGLHG